MHGIIFSEMWTSETHKTSGGSMTQLQATDTNIAHTPSPKTLTILDAESLISQIKITSVGYTCEVGCKLDAGTIVESESNTKYVKAKQLEFALMKIDHPKATAKIFKTGKLNVTGAQSPELAILSSQVASLPFQSVIQEVANFCAAMDTLTDQDESWQESQV